MSEPVTNVEIEDVLSSIRRLVSDGDKARTRDTAPVELAAAPAADASVPDVVASESGDVMRADKLVLTPAFLVADRDMQPVEDAQTQDTAQDTAEPEGDADPVADIADVAQDEDTHVDDAQDDEPEHDAGYFDGEDEGPLALTEMVWDTPLATTARPEAGDDNTQPEDVQNTGLQTPDRSELVATIAGLEAAISGDTDEFEPDGSELDAREPMVETLAWPGTIVRPFDQVEEAEVTPDAEPESEPETPEIDAPLEMGNDNRVMPFQRSTTNFSDPILTEAAHIEEPHFEDGAEAAETEAEIEAEIEAAEAGDAFEDAIEGAQKSGQPDVAADVYADDEDLDGLLEAGGISLDEEALRALVSDVVREELTGPLGERITRNVRKLVRREIYRVLSSQDFD